MADGSRKQERLESEVRQMALKEEESDVDMDNVPVAGAAKGAASASLSGSGTPASSKRQSRSPIKRQSGAGTPTVKFEQEEVVGGDVTLKMEPGKPPKLARSTSHKVEKRPPQLFAHYEDKTAEASASFDVLPECTYANKYLGTTEHALECDCVEEWGAYYAEYLDGDSHDN